jgi:hypothetical protein
MKYTRCCLQRVSKWRPLASQVLVFSIHREPAKPHLGLSQQSLSQLDAPTSSVIDYMLALLRS